MFVDGLLYLELGGFGLCRMWDLVMVLFDVMLDVLFVDVGLWLFDFGVVDGDCWCVIGELV